MSLGKGSSSNAVFVERDNAMAIPEADERAVVTLAIDWGYVDLELSVCCMLWSCSRSTW